MTERLRILEGDAIGMLRTLPDESVHCIVTSPPYWSLRSYQTKEHKSPQIVWGGDSACEHEWEDDAAAPVYRRGAGVGTSSALTNPERQGTIPRLNGTQKVCARCQGSLGDFGGEANPDCLAWARSEPPCTRCYLCRTRRVLAELHRVLRKDGTAWWNISDTQFGPQGRGTAIGEEQKEQQVPMPNLKHPHLKAKDRSLIPQRVALSAQADGWWVRTDVVWSKASSMPESTRDRPSFSHEYIFLLTKNADYFYDWYAAREPAVGTKNDTRERNGMGPKAQGAPVESRMNGRFMNATKQQAYPERNYRSVWHLTTEPLTDYAHFAAYPSEIPRRAITAGTSELGVCASCGAPYERVFAPKKRYRSYHDHTADATEGRAQGGGLAGDKFYDEYERPKQVGWASSLDAPGKWEAAEGANGNRDVVRNLREARAESGDHEHPFTPPEHIGWKPKCPCGGTEIVGATVLDPFLGSGTTAIVALQMGRSAIGIELNHGYVEMARERIRKETEAVVAARQRLEPLRPLTAFGESEAVE